MKSLIKSFFTGILIIQSYGLFSQNYMVTTIAGSGVAGLLDGIGINAQCEAPYELYADGSNTIYFCDTYNHAIRKYDKTSGQVTTIAGNGTIGYQDGPLTNGSFNYPEGICPKEGFSLYR